MARSVTLRGNVQPVPCVTVFLVSLGAAVLLAACGDADTTGGSTGVLVVTEILPARPVYTEGSIAYLRLEQADGKLVMEDRPVTEVLEPRGGRLLRRRLPGGRYRVISYQRPCQGNCSHLEPPTDRCETVVQVRAGRTVQTTVVLGQRDGCRLRQSLK